MVTPHAEFAAKAHPAEWLRVADNLLDQAVSLHKQPAGFVTRSFPVEKWKRWPAQNRAVFLLAGFALQNAIKAFLIFEHPDWISNGALSKKLRNHDLSALHQLATTVPYKKRSGAVIAAFAAGLQSWARYPCGLRSDDIEDEEILTDELWQAYLKLMAAYGRRLEKLLTATWTGPHGDSGRMTFAGQTQLDYITSRPQRPRA